MSISRQLDNGNFIDLTSDGNSTSGKPVSSPKDGVHMQIVNGYELMTIGKKKIVSESFPNRLDFDTATKREIISRGQQALLANGLVFAYKKNKVICAVFIVDKNEKSFDCTNAYISSEVSDRSAEEMAMDIRRQVSLLVYYANFPGGTYLGQNVSKIEKEKRSCAWLIAMVIGLAFAACFYPVMHNIGASFLMGFSQTALWYAILCNRLVYRENKGSSNEENS